MHPSREDAGQNFLVVDGGGSKVAGLIAKTSAVPSRPPQIFRSSLAGVGAAAESHWERACRNIVAVVEDLLRQADVEAQGIAHAVFMLAGAGRPQDVERVHTSLMQHPQLAQFRRRTVTSDIMPLLIHAQQLEPHCACIVTIVGTGSLVATLDAQPQLIRAGGWGPILGDQGSGWRIAQVALTQVCDWMDRGCNLQDADGQEMFNAVELFLVEKQLLSADHQPLSAGRDEFATALLKLSIDRHLAAQLAPRIIELARTQANGLCEQIVAEQISALCGQIRCVHQQLQLGTQPWRLCLAGGLVCNQAAYRELLFSSLATHGLTPEFHAVLEPLEAALTFARR